MKIKLPIMLITLSCIVVLTCSWTTSLFPYMKGITCLESGQVSEAIKYLKEAVELEPLKSQNQGTLAVAYIQAGDWAKAWYHARQAVLCETCTNTDLKVFMLTYQHMVVDKGLNKIGTPYTVIEEALGLPDIWGHPVKEKHPDHAAYGLCFMTFTEGKLDTLETPGFPKLGTNTIKPQISRE